ncbi:MAG: SPOR domain-containing protein [Gammaproteobacteria bacterium]
MDQKLKERVFGALVVVAIAVIFVPMLLDKQQDQAVNISEAIPTPPIEETALADVPQQVAEIEETVNQQHLESVTAALPKEAAPVAPETNKISTEIVQAAQVEIPAQPKAAIIAVAPTPAPIQPTAKTPALATPKAAPATTAAAREYRVQEMPIASVSSASATNDFLAENDETGMSRVSSAAADFAAEEKPAQAAIAETAAIEKPKAIQKSSETVAAAVQPNEAGWAIQLGTFANHSNAKALERKLKDKGYAAFSYEVESGHQKLTRVLVGPEAKREDAARMVSKLEANVQIKGVVIRYEPLA